eukprot:11746041-Alexandrium_andersonii.AAC.1
MDEDSVPRRAYVRLDPVQEEGEEEEPRVVDEEVDDDYDDDDDRDSDRGVDDRRNDPEGFIPLRA